MASLGPRQNWIAEKTLYRAQTLPLLVEKFVTSRSTQNYSLTDLQDGRVHFYLR